MAEFPVIFSPLQYVPVYLTPESSEAPHTPAAVHACPHTGDWYDRTQNRTDNKAKEEHSDAPKRGAGPVSAQNG